MSKLGKEIIEKLRAGSDKLEDISSAVDDLIAQRADLERQLASAQALAERRKEALEDLEKRLLWLSTYEKEPSEVVKDDFAYDRLLASVKSEASKWAEIARAAIEEGTMDAETAEIYKQGLIAMHDERHPDGD